MPRVSLHGVPITWSFEGSEPDPLAEILGPFGPEPVGPAQSEGIEFILRPAPESAGERPETEGYSPEFFIGIIQAYRGAYRAGDRANEENAAPAPVSPLLLWNRASRVHIPLDGSPIVALIAPASREITPGSTSAMLHIALALALRRLGLFALHAAAVVHPSGAPILIAGASGAGKTTTAIALIEAGASYLGDESVLIRAPSEGSNGAPILALPRAFHVGPATLKAFPRLTELAGPRAGQPDKLAIDPRRAFPGRALLESALPALILFPSVVGADSTELSPLSRADALGQLTISSAAILIQGMPRRDENINALRRLVEASNSYELRLGSDMIKAPIAALAPLVERARGAR